MRFQTQLRLLSMAALLAVLGARTLAQPTTASPSVAPNGPRLPGIMQLSIDATDVERAIFSGRLVLPVIKSGPMVLLFPRWVPGHHAPSGPIARIAGIQVRAGGRDIAWQRDPVMMHALHVVVPQGAKAIEVDFQYLSPTDPKMGRVEVTPDMIDLQWTSMAPYPQGYASRDMTVQATVRLPRGWGYATALENASIDNASTGGDTIRFRPVDYETLVDSPIVAGRYHRREILDTNGPAPVMLDLFADAPELLDARPEQIEAHREMVRQAYKLFRSHHYDRYTFLTGLTAQIGGLGAEHHQSSENFTAADYFTDWASNAPARELLPHELVHSWNGKFRRGADLLTPTLDTPMRNSLLWAYEGLTRYYGAVLATRAGLHTLDEARDNFAVTAALMENRAGRQWRPLADTVNHSIYAEGAQPWPNWQRGTDYYLEGQLLWLDVDTRMRALSEGKKSLDDFARAFFGVRSGDRRPLPYLFDDIANALNDQVAYDWRRFLRDRIEKVQPTAPLDGLTRGGYRLVYTDTPTPFFRALEKQRKISDFSYSIGLTVDAGGIVGDVVWDSPAFAAALTIGTKILAVDGKAFTADTLRNAIGGCKGRDTPLALKVRRGPVTRDVAVNCAMGLRYPRLARDAGNPARLDDILAPLK